jgi:peptidoglycan/xylan/chitin deacetylase (PgdA/CDA1 family)
MAGYIDREEVLGLQSSGHEIGGHTRIHPDLTKLLADQITAELSGNRADLLSIGAAPILSLAYPYGLYNDQIKQLVQAAGFTSARTVNAGLNVKTSDKFALLAESVGATTTLDQIKTWVDTAVANKAWLILTLHQVDQTGAEYGTTPAILQGLVDYLTTNNVPVHTISEGLALM